MPSSIQLPEHPDDRFYKSWKGVVFFFCIIGFFVLKAGGSYLWANFNTEFKKIAVLAKTRPEILADLPFVFSIGAEENGKRRKRWESTEHGGFYHIVVYGYASARDDMQQRRTYCLHFKKHDDGSISIESVSRYCDVHDRWN